MLFGYWVATTQWFQCATLLLSSVVAVAAAEGTIVGSGLSMT